MLGSWNVAHCFQPLWPWSQESSLEKMHPQQIANIIYGSSSIFGMYIHLGPWRVINCVQVTVTLTSGFGFGKVEPRAYLYIIWGRNPKFCVRIYFGIMACRIHFWVSLTCSLYITMLKHWSFSFTTLLIMPRLSEHEQSDAIGMILAFFESN